MSAIIRVNKNGRFELPPPTKFMTIRNEKCSNIGTKPLESRYTFYVIKIGFVGSKSERRRRKKRRRRRRKRRRRKRCRRRRNRSRRRRRRRRRRSRRRWGNRKRRRRRPWEMIGIHAQVEAGIW